MEAVSSEPYDGKADLHVLAKELQYEADELFAIAETLQLLRFVELEGGGLRLTPAARRYVEADVDDRKQLFAQHLLAHVPLAGHIRHVLDERASHQAPAARFRDELENSMSPDYASPTLKAVTSWARYAEVFAYDEGADRFTLDDPN